MKTVKERIIEKKVEFLNGFWSPDYLVLGRNLLYQIQTELTDAASVFSTKPKQINLKTGDELFGMRLIVVNVDDFIAVSGEDYK